MMSMRKVKKLSLVFACLVLLTAAICQVASAAENSTHASQYLCSYGAELSPGGPRGSGKLDIDFNVVATEISDKVGISKVEFYWTDDTYITTIKGTVENGLLIEDDLAHMDTYTYTGVSGKTYYAVLTVYAERDGGHDAKIYTTNTATAP